MLYNNRKLKTLFQAVFFLFTDWLKAAEAFETMALFTFLAAIATSAIYAFVPDFEGDMRILGAALASCAITGNSVLLLI